MLREQEGSDLERGGRVDRANIFHSPQFRIAESNRIGASTERMMAAFNEELDEVQRRQRAGESLRSIQEDLRHRKELSKQQELINEVKALEASSSRRRASKR